MDEKFRVLNEVLVKMALKLKRFFKKLVFRKKLKKNL